MKAFKTISTIALAALVLASCQEKELEVSPVLTPDSLIKVGEQITINATRDAEQTKTVLQSDNSIWWSPADKISIIYGDSSDYSKGEFTSQNTEPAATAQFSGTLNTVIGASEGSSSTGKYLYGVFPAKDLVILKSYNGDETLEVPFKADQVAVEGSFDPEAVTAMARSNSLNLAFYNVVSVLALTVQEDGVSKIKLENMTSGVESIGATRIEMAFNDDGTPKKKGCYLTHYVSLVPPAGQDTFTKGKTYYMAVVPGTYTQGLKFTLTTASGNIELPITATVTAERSKIHAMTLKKKQLEIKTLWLKQSEGTTAWNAYYGGTGGSDRNIAMDDEYVYIAENSGTAKLWAISIDNPDNVIPVNVEGVSGGTHLLACPRVIKNMDQNVNGGKDVLICSNLTRGGEDPKLYMWINGIDHAPKAITLTTWATTPWYGDVFTVFGTLQDGVLFFDKIGGEEANGVVTFILNGVPSGNNMYLQARLKFNDTYGSHSGACAYYPYPDNINKGVYSPGRGVEARGQNVVATGDLKGEGGIDVALTGLAYDEGTNGYVLGYNFIEWQGKRYVIYGNQSSSTVGYVRVREGSMDTDWSVIASSGTRLYRRDLNVASGSLSSGNSGMDVTARVINGDLYFAAQKQNVACGLYKLCYE